MKNAALRLSSEPDRFLANSASLALSQIVVTSLAVLTNIIIARELGPEGKGVIALFFLIPALLALFGGIGMDVANSYLTGKGAYPIAEIVGNSFLLALIVTPTVALVYLTILALARQSVFGSADLTVLLASFSLMPVYLLGSFMWGILIGLKRASRVALCDVIGVALNMILIIVAVIHAPLSVWEAIGALSLGAAVRVSLLLSFVLRAVPGVKLYNPSLLKESLRFGLKGHWGNLVQLLNYRLDALLVNKFIGATELGLYSVAVSIAELLWLIPQALAANLLPKTAGADPSTLKRFTPQVVKAVVILVTVGALTVGLLSPFAINLIFTDAFASSVEPLRWLLPGVIALSVSKVLSADLIGRGKPHYGGIASSVALVVTIALDFTLIPWLGMKGAAIASSFSYITLLVVNLALYLRESGNGVWDIVVVRKADIRVWTDMLFRQKARLEGDVEI